MKLSPQSLAAAIIELVSTLPADKKPHLADAVISLLEREGQLRLLRLLPPFLERAYYKKQGIQRVNVAVFPKLDTTETKKLSAALSKAIGTEIELHEHEDASLIGGACIALGDERLDFSIAGALKTASSHLTSH